MTAVINGVTVKLEIKDSPLPFHRAGKSFTKTGYGRRIPSVCMARFPNEKRWRRIYVCCFSNAGTAYIEDRKNLDEKGRPGWIVVA